MDSGASPEALSAWDSFAGKVDLMTFGLSMMNLTDGQGSLTSKVARSMQAGIDAKTAQGDKASGTATAARKEARDERELRTKEVKAASDAQLNAAKYNEALANAQKLLASAEGEGGDFIDNPQILGAFTEMAIAREIRNPEAAALDLAQSAQKIYTEAQAAGLTDFSVADAFDASVEQASAKVGSKFYDKWGWGR